MTTDLDRKARELATEMRDAADEMAADSFDATETVRRWADRVEAALRLAVPEWRPIETAPRDGTTVMIHERWEDVPIFASWHKGKWYADTSNYDGDAGVYDKICQHNVTHWQPLPAAPTLADEGES